MNKHILTLVDNELNPDKYTKNQLIADKDQSCPILSRFYHKSYTYSGVISSFFQSPSENKQDYIDQINKDNSVRELDLITKAVCEYKCNWQGGFDVDDFNNHIKELSGCPVALKEWQDGLEAHRNPVSNIVYHEGKGYEVGAIYEFSDSGSVWSVDILTGKSSDGLYPFLADGNEYAICRKSKNKIGTIKEQPAELIDGKAYCFDYNAHSPLMKFACHGVYKKERNRFITSDGFVVSAYCSNIKPLTLDK